MVNKTQVKRCGINHTGAGPRAKEGGAKQNERREETAGGGSLSNKMGNKKLEQKRKKQTNLKIKTHIAGFEPLKLRPRIRAQH